MEEDRFMAYIDPVLKYMVQQGASDLHITSESYPYLRVDGQMRFFGQKQLSANEVKSLIEEILPEVNKKEFEQYQETDFSYHLPEVGGFRANVFMERRGISAVFRHIPARIYTLEELGLPPVVAKLCTLQRGLVLVTGPTGSGKSTTLAAMIDFINKSRPGHILTLEDPIEFIHQNHQCLVRQREIYRHSTSFSAALRAALREDPDVVLVGELRDLETTKIALELSETGHLVYASLHTTSAQSTVERLVHQFPHDEQTQVRSMLADSLKGIISQTLCRRIEGGRVAALEVLLVTTPVASNIREGKIHQIPMAMLSGKRLGMIKLNESLLQLVQQQIIAPEEAWLKSIDREVLVKELHRLGIPFQPPRVGETVQEEPTDEKKEKKEKKKEYIDEFEEFRRRGGER